MAKGKLISNLLNTIKAIGDSKAARKTVAISKPKTVVKAAGSVPSIKTSSKLTSSVVSNVAGGSSARSVANTVSIPKIRGKFIAGLAGVSAIGGGAYIAAKGVDDVVTDFSKTSSQRKQEAQTDINKENISLGNQQADLMERLLNISDMGMFGGNVPDSGAAGVGSGNLFEGISGLPGSSTETEEGTSILPLLIGTGLIVGGSYFAVKKFKKGKRGKK